VTTQKQVLMWRDEGKEWREGGDGRSVTQTYLAEELWSEP